MCFIRLGFVNFIMREVQDHHATLLDGLLRMVLKMLAQWKTIMTMPESERKVRYHILHSRLTLTKRE